MFHLRMIKVLLVRIFKYYYHIMIIIIERMVKSGHFKESDIARYACDHFIF